MALDPGIAQEIRRFQAQYDRNPDSFVFARLADAYRKAGDAARALELLDRGLERHPRYLSAHIVRARALAELGRPEEAAAAYRRVLELDPQNLVALRAVASMAREAGRWGEAAGAYRKLREVDPLEDEVRQRVVEAERRLARERAEEPSTPAARRPVPEAREPLEASPGAAGEPPAAPEAERPGEAPREVPGEPPEAGEPRAPPEAREAERPPEAREAERPPETREAERPPEAREAEAGPETGQAEEPQEAGEVEAGPEGGEAEGPPGAGQAEEPEARAALAEEPGERAEEPGERAEEPGERLEVGEESPPRPRDEDLVVTATMGDLFLRQELYEQAVRIYERLLATRPGDPFLWEKLETARRLARGRARGSRATAGTEPSRPAGGRDTGPAGAAAPSGGEPAEAADGAPAPGPGAPSGDEPVTIREYLRGLLEGRAASGPRPAGPGSRFERWLRRGEDRRR